MVGNMNTITALMADVNLGNFSFDAYELPDGEKRVGFAGASNVFGHSKEWLGRLHKNDSKQLKVLQGMGYSGLHKEVSVFVKGNATGNYGTRVNTISVHDFTKLAVYEALKKKNERAIIILAAMAEFGIEQVIDMAFQGKSLDRILSKIVHFSQWTYDDFMQALQDNRDDVANLALGIF